MQTIGIRFAILILYTALAAACVVVPQQSDTSNVMPPPDEVMASEVGAVFVVEPEPLPESVYYAEEPEVLVPVIIGEPVYYAPPIVVTYQYDYFTYEQSGSYINLVFWRNGRRYRSEPWRTHGRRMTVERMRSEGYAHRVRHSEARHHHELLERNHRIHRPETPHQGRRDDRRHRDDRGRNHKDEKVKQVPQPRQQNTPPPARNSMLRATLPRERPASPQQQAPSHREKRIPQQTAQPPKQTPAPQPAQQGDQPPKNIFGVRNK